VEVRIQRSVAIDKNSRVTSIPGRVGGRPHGRKLRAPTI
jgi:hypothetical protein